MSDKNPSDGCFTHGETWRCRSCNEVLTGKSTFYFRIRGDLTIKNFCNNCFHRNDRTPTAEERAHFLNGLASQPWAIRTFRRWQWNRRSLGGYERRFMRKLNKYDYLSEIARRDGNWRTK